MTHRRAGVLVMAWLGAAAVGCGPEGARRADMHVTVTEDFGARQVRQAVRPAPSAGDSVLDVLSTTVRVSTPAGERAPHAIEGRSARGSVAWSLFVNGVAPGAAAAATDAHGGERIWVDLHDQRAAPRIRAVVGSFPEPFRHGLDGERFPVRVECAQPGSRACDLTLDRFIEAGVPAAPGRLRGSFTTQTLRVLVGRWPQLRGDDSAIRLELGPAASGVFARPAADGRSLALLDSRTRVSRVLGAGSGLVAATAGPEVADPELARPPIWVVTGADDQGVFAAARALTEMALRNRFALAVTGSGERVPLPEPRR